MISLTQFADTVIEIMPVILKELVAKQSDEIFKGTVTPLQFMILSFLKDAGEIKMTEIANFMDSSTAAATGVIDRLVKIGYAERTFDFKDRRVIRIKVTLKGANLVKKITEQRRQSIIKVFGKLDPADRDNYLQTLTKLRDILNSEKLKTNEVA